MTQLNNMNKALVAIKLRGLFLYILQVLGKPCGTAELRPAELKSFLFLFTGPDESVMAVVRREPASEMNRQGELSALHFAVLCVCYRFWRLLLQELLLQLFESFFLLSGNCQTQALREAWRG